MSVFESEKKSGSSRWLRCKGQLVPRGVNGLHLACHASSPEASGQETLTPERARHSLLWAALEDGKRHVLNAIYVERFRDDERPRSRS